MRNDKMNNDIDELDLKNKEKDYINLLLTVVLWVNYLKKEYSNSKEYEEAKKLIMTFGEKHKKLYDWCQDLISRPLK